MSQVASKICGICGCKFEAENALYKYCSDKCRKIAKRSRDQSYGSRRSSKKKPTKPKYMEKECTICHKTYYGHFNSKYCESCLASSVQRIRRYLDNRTRSEEEIKKIVEGKN